MAPVVGTPSAKPEYITIGEALGYARKAGFSPTRKTSGIGHDVWIVAIGIMESQLNIWAHNDNALTGDDSYGVLQINMLGRMGPERRKWFGIASNQDLYKPEVNFRAAYLIYKSRGFNFQDWSTYPFPAVTQIPKVSKQKPSDPIETATTQTAIGTPFQLWLKDNLPSVGNAEEAIQRVALFVGGGVLLVVGLIMLFGSANTVQDAAKTVAQSIPVGRALRGGR